MRICGELMMDGSPLGLVLQMLSALRVLKFECILDAYELKFAFRQWPLPGTTLAVGMLFTLAAVVYAAFRAGSNTGLFRLDGSDAGDPSSEVRLTARGNAIISTTRSS